MDVCCLIHTPTYNKKVYILYLHGKHYQFIISDFKALIRKFSKFPPRNLKSLSTFSMILMMKRTRTRTRTSATLMWLLNKS